MESCALTLFKSTLDSKPLNRVNRITRPKIIPNNINYKTPYLNHSVISFTSYSLFNNSSAFPVKRFYYDPTVARAAAAPETSGEFIEPAKIGWTNLQVAAMFVAWYLLNIYFNIFNKQVALPLTFKYKNIIWICMNIYYSNFYFILKL